MADGDGADKREKEVGRGAGRARPGARFGPMVVRLRGEVDGDGLRWDVYLL